jgi:hypothetical protein
MLLSFALYAGLLLIAAGVVALIPRRTRGKAPFAVLAGFALVVIAAAWPPRESRVKSPQTHLDAIIPAWQFDEVHAIHVNAPPERVYAAARAVTADEILLFRTLTAIRRLGRRTPPNILNAPRGEPLLDVATRGGFRWLADDPPRELVVGTRIGPKTVAVMNFLIEPDGRGGSNLSTTTRVHASTSRAARVFALYWRVIQPGSDIIRRSWLRAIRRRGEAAA